MRPSQRIVIFGIAASTGALPGLTLAAVTINGITYPGTSAHVQTSSGTVKSAIHNQASTSNNSGNIIKEGEAVSSIRVQTIINGSAKPSSTIEVYSTPPSENRSAQQGTVQVSNKKSSTAYTNVRIQANSPVSNVKTSTAVPKEQSSVVQISLPKSDNSPSTRNAQTSVSERASQDVRSGLWHGIQRFISWLFKWT